MQITSITLASHDEIAGIGMTDFFRLTEEQPKPVDVENLKYLLKDNFTGKFYWTSSLLAFQFSYIIFKYTSQ